MRQIVFPHMLCVSCVALMRFRYIQVVDEPLYAAWSVRNPQEFRPYRETLLKSQENDADKVVSDLILGVSLEGWK